MGATLIGILGRIGTHPNQGWVVLQTYAPQISTQVDVWVSYRFMPANRLSSFFDANIDFHLSTYHDFVIQTIDLNFW